jgi:hypothetical protein
MPVTQPQYDLGTPFRNGVAAVAQRQPLISRIDEKLLVAVAGIEPAHAKLLCADFESSWITASSWSEYGERGAQLFAKGFRSFWRRVEVRLNYEGSLPS